MSTTPEPAKEWGFRGGSPPPWYRRVLCRLGLRQRLHADHGLWWLCPWCGKTSEDQ